MSILDLPMPENHVGAETMREYFKEILVELWKEGESFSGKRPLGNSDWQEDFYIALIMANMVEGELDEDGWIEDCDYEKADDLILQALEEL